MIKSLGCQLYCNWCIVQRRIGNNAIERTFEFAHTVAFWSGDVINDGTGNRKVERIGLGAENRQAMLVFGSLHISQQAPLKPRTKTILQARNGLGWAITRN